MPQQLLAHGYLACCGQIVDASLVQARVQRNKGEDAESVKEGTMPIAWKAHRRAQKDVDAKWTKKHGKNHFGYKLHASVDKRHKLIHKVIITDAAVAYTTVFEELLNPNNTSRDVYANRGYPSAEREATLKRAGWRVHIQRKGNAIKPISDTQKQRNRSIATPHAHVEHLFGAMRQMSGKLVHCMGIVRTTFALNLKAANYNLQRLALLKNEVSRPSIGSITLIGSTRMAVLALRNQKIQLKFIELRCAASSHQKRVIRGTLKREGWQLGRNQDLPPFATVTSAVQSAQPR